MSVEFDFAKRKALASELQKIMVEELPIVPLWSRKAILASSEALGNVAGELPQRVAAALRYPSPF